MLVTLRSQRVKRPPQPTMSIKLEIEIRHPQQSCLHSFSFLGEEWRKIRNLTKNGLVPK